MQQVNGNGIVKLYEKYFQNYVLVVVGRCLMMDSSYLLSS